MRSMIAAFTMLSMSGISWADSATTRFKIENGRIIVAQSYCGCALIARRRAASAVTVPGHAFKRAMTCSETAVSKIAERDGTGKLWRLRTRVKMKAALCRANAQKYADRMSAWRG